ncbi:MAG TPA: colicin D domain-containing protein [Hyalangium sp.]|jgi:hypothetical protein|nr:colicin D domain-containing protein [Hyalangium sp.]
MSGSTSDPAPKERQVLGAPERALRCPAKQLQKKFKHAQDFGVTSDYNPENARLFERALLAHVQDEATQIIAGTYRGKPVTHFFNPSSHLNVVRDANGDFETGWRLSPEQERHVLANGSLGGG